MDAFQFLDRIPCGILILNIDDDFTISYSNNTVRTLFQAPLCLKDMVREPEYAALTQNLWLCIKNGEDKFQMEFGCYLASFQYRKAEHALYGAILDISGQKEIQESLRVQAQQYRLASQQSGSVVSIYDILLKTLSPSPEFSKCFPHPCTDPLTPGFFLENGIVHRESASDFMDFFTSMEQGLPDGKYILRLKIDSGEYHWFSTRYSLVRGQDQKPLRGIISCQDISDQYEKELAYQRWREYMREQKKDCMGYYEYNLKYDLFEEIIGDMMNTLPEYALNSFSNAMSYIASHFVYEEDKEKYLKFFNKNQLLNHYCRGNCSLKLEHRRLREDGTIYWSLGLVQMVSDPYTDTIKAFILIKDIDEPKREALTLQELSELDSLTGLYNRPTAIRAITHILKNKKGHHILIMLDIDRFKQLNDRYGHQYGDNALHRAASRLKSALRREDIFGRLGGDEFIILLKDVSYSMDLYARLENLCSLIESALEPEAHISGSLGTAAYPEDGTSFDELYEKADIALYHAKKHGRNQYVVYESGMNMKEF